MRKILINTSLDLYELVYNSTNKSNGVVLENGTWHNYIRGLKIGDSIVKKKGEYEVYCYRKDSLNKYRLKDTLYINKELKDLLKIKKKNKTFPKRI